MEIIKEYIRDENKYSGIYMEQPDNLKYCHNFDHYLKFGNFTIYEEYLESNNQYNINITFLYLIISHYKYFTYTFLTDRTDIFEVFEAILKEEFKREIRKEKLKQIEKFKLIIKT